MSTPSASDPKRRGLSPLVAIFITVLIDLLGFSMFIPDLQLRGKELAQLALGPAASSQQIGQLVGISIAAFSIAQLLTSPLLGRISDTKGRRSVLLISSGLSVFAYLLYANATSLGVMVLSRALCGIAAANLGVAFAYVADTSRPEDRAKNLGLLGAAFGIGFIVGPVIGSKLLQMTQNSPTVLGYVSAALVGVNFIFILTSVPESLKPGNVAKKPQFFADMKRAFRTPGLGLLLHMFFAAQLGFTNLETTYFLLLEDPKWIFAFGEQSRVVGSYILATVGVVGVIVQGFLIRKINPILGELKTVRYFYLLFVPMFALVPFAKIWIPGIFVIIGLGLANGLSQPSLSSMISRSAPADMQGGIFGVTQALGALARSVGPLMSVPLFAFKPYAPYLAGAMIALFPTICAWIWLKEPTKAPGEPMLTH